MVLYLRITSNYWACNENEYLFEFEQSSNFYGTDKLVVDHWFSDETNTLDYNIKESRKLENRIQNREED